MAAPSFAQKAETEEKSASPRLTLRVGEHPTFDRLVFDGPRGLAYTLRREGSTVTLAFSAPAKVDLRPAANLSRARHLAVVAETPKLSLRFTVAPKALLKDFVSASSIVIDISGPNASAEIPPPAPSKPEPPKAEEKPAPVSESAKPAPIASPPPVSETKEQSSASAQPLKTEPTAPLPAAVVPPPAQPVAPPPTPAPTVPVTSTPAPAAMAVPPLPEIGAMPVLIATLDPKIDLGAAIFERGGYVNILFDRKLTSSPVVLANGAPLQVALQPFDRPHNSCFRFALPPRTEVRATRVDTAWQIFLTRQRSEVPVSTRLVAQPDFALGARLILPTTNAPDPVKFIDPTVGDTLFVVPLRDTTAFNVNRRMADLFLLPTAQGLVIKPLHEKVVVRSVSDGVEITAEGGLKLSPASDTGAAPQGARKTRKAMPGKTMFDFDLWRGKPNETFTETRQKLMQSVADVTESQRNLARIDLARFYFAHSMGEETLALLTILTQQMPDLTTRPEFLALRGAARLLADRAQEGLRDLDAPGLESLPEIDLWQGVGAAQLRDWTTAEEKFSFAEDVLANYPEPFFSRFSVLAIESALAANKDREAAEWLDRLETQPHLPEIIPAMRYLRGVLHSKSGHADTAENLWRSVAKSNDRLYKIFTHLAPILLQWFWR
ncbi:MAG: hypothetical protein HGA90_05665 [Alphaproteobacteria bacterium]|nr:hypothetical protein [Alphaproteobacteria bacterium]